MSNSSSRRLASVLAFSLLTGVAGSAWATPEADLATAENAYAALDYATAASAAEQVLSQRALSHDALTRATRVAALSHAALGQSDAAKQSFILLLEYDQDFKIDPKLGPRFAEPFAEARGYWQAQGRKPSLAVQSLVTYGQPGQLRVTTTDPMNAVKRVTIGYRWAPAHDYVTASVDPGTHSVDVPANPNSGSAGRLDYYVRALDAKDGAVFEEGNPDAPKAVVVNEPPAAAAGVREEKKSFFTSVPFLVGAGVIVAAAAVGAFFAFRPTEFSPATTGRGVLGASCGNVRCE